MSQVTDLIPHRPPFLFVDEIVSETADGLIAKRTLRAVFICLEIMSCGIGISLWF